jgi:hypothetical protein
VGGPYYKVYLAYFLYLKIIEIKITQKAKITLRIILNTATNARTKIMENVVANPGLVLTQAIASTKL